MAENELTMEDRWKLAKDFYETTSYDQPPADDFMERSDPQREVKRVDGDIDLHEDAGDPSSLPALRRLKAERGA